MSSSEAVAHRGLPAGIAGVATGWYQVAWSGELAAGAPAVPLRSFGRDLAAYRGESGGVAVVDAFCPHLGAHLGHGGTVVGDSLVCPFHGWQWGRDGENELVPYGPRPAVRNRLRTWPVREVDGHVFVWFDEAGREPFLPCEVTCEPPGTFREAYPDFVRIWKSITIPYQFPPENLVDFAHLRFVHLADEVAELVEYEVVDGRFRTDLGLLFGGGRPSTWMTPNGPVKGRIVNDIWSLGYSTSRFEVNDEGRADMVLTTATTPVDGEVSDLRITIMVRSDASDDLAAKWREQEIVQTARDIPIWEHMRYIEHPPLVGDEAKAFRALREWRAGFFAGGANGAHADDDGETEGTEEAL